MDRLNEEQLAQLTDAEREGYELMLAEDEDEGAADEETEGTDDEDEAGGDGGASVDDEQDEEGSAEDEADSGEQEDDDAAAADDDSETAAQDQPEEASADEVPPAPAAKQIDFDAPLRIQREIEAIEQKQAQLLEQFDDGEITREEFLEKDKEFRAELATQLKTQGKAEAAIEDASAAYLGQVDQFLAENQQYKPGGLLFNLLNEKVKSAQAEARKNGASPLSIELVQKAHAEIQAELGLPAKSTKPTANDKKEAKAAKGGKVEKKPEKQPAKRDMPPNLNGLPSDDINDAADDNGHYAYLSRLAVSEPLEFEKKFKAMSAEQQDEFLRYGG
ncbi:MULTISPECIES: hypothetical protein [unclassified Brucella]|uniref:hypothetical protein n=1 Tax=unclassified Brucella TaxID=2632610 RepID=UPI0012AD7153|nr:MULTISPECIES: hypothetical protein [unclassified Brucella]MRN43455.1 hypothetical protein [Brucella sp. 09RB8913]MRN59430.1 hypothetical protein [Brucella sp. 09RB8918]MRN67975.1 hypothetical protein [Brucella sp. 10RB9213]